MKNKIYTSLKKNPSDNSKYREEYVTIVPEIWNDVLKATDLESIENI